MLAANWWIGMPGIMPIRVWLIETHWTNAQALMLPDNCCTEPFGIGQAVGLGRAQKEAQV